MAIVTSFPPPSVWHLCLFGNSFFRAPANFQWDYCRRCRQHTHTHHAHTQKLANTKAREHTHNNNENHLYQITWNDRRLLIIFVRRIAAVKQRVSNKIPSGLNELCGMRWQNDQCSAHLQLMVFNRWLPAIRQARNGKWNKQKWNSWCTLYAPRLKWYSLSLLIWAYKVEEERCFHWN